VGAERSAVLQPASWSYISWSRRLKQCATALLLIAALRFHAAMLTAVVITIFGPDRPGLVEALAVCVTTHGGNWLESRLLHLGGHFTGIVRVEVDEGRLGELATGLRTAEIPNLHIVVHDTRVSGEAASPARPTIALEVVGHDRPGIVRAISRALADRGVNVEELATERTSAPMSGEPLFHARVTVALPPGLDAATLRADLEKIASDLMVDVRLSDRR
jgi:glycine cleavage system regulatory protein